MKYIVKTISIFLIFIFIFSGCSNAQKSNKTKEKIKNVESQNIASLKAEEGISTIAIMSDTQKYAGSSPKTFEAMTDFLAKSIDYLNLKYVVHTGDIVNEPDSKDQWQVANKAFTALDGVIPYGVLAGNHDQSNGTQRYSNFLNNFGDTRFSSGDEFAKSFGNGIAMSQLITIGSIDFIFVYLCDDPSIEMVKFANEQFAAYPERVGVLCVHRYLEDNGKGIRLCTDGEALRDMIIKESSNVQMVLCGHESFTGYYEDKLDDGRNVTAIISNYQEKEDVDGSMLFLQIDENNQKIKAITYSPVEKSFEGHKDKTIKDEFTLNINWKGKS